MKLPWFYLGNFQILCSLFQIALPNMWLLVLIDHVGYVIYNHFPNINNFTKGHFFTGHILFLIHISLKRILGLVTERGFQKFKLKDK